MKSCSKCKEVKELNEFCFKNKKHNILQSYCKECKKIMDKECYYKGDRKTKIRMNAKNSIIRAKAFVKRFKSFCSCEKCGDQRSYVLDFHHIRDKSFNVCDMTHSGSSIKNIKNEIRKCKILCANCHRELHYLQNGEEAN